MNNSMEKIKVYLKNAGIDDENLSNEHIIELYNTVKVSEKTIQDEEHSRMMNKTLDEEEQILKSSQSSCEIISVEEKVESEPKKAKTQHKSRPNTAVKCNNNNNNNIKKNKSNEEVENENELSLIERPFVTIKHPLIQSEEFLARSIDERVKMLHEFYNKRDDILNKLARRSLRAAPLPDPIVLPIINGESKAAPAESQNDEEHLSFSRFGRQVRKRRLYDNFDEDSMDDFVTKKSKSDDEDDGSNGEWPAASQSSKRSNSKSKKETENKNVSKSRHQRILDGVAAINEKEEKNVQKMDEFDKLLNSTVTGDINDNEKMIVDEDESPSKSGVPLVAKRQPLDRHKAVKKIETLPIRKEKMPKKPSARANNTSNNNKPENNCPICHSSFSQYMLERHVQKCLDAVSKKVEFPLFTSTSSVCCSVCDSVFLTEEALEEHKATCYS